MDTYPITYNINTGRYYHNGNLILISFIDDQDELETELELTKFLMYKELIEITVTGFLDLKILRLNGEIAPLVKDLKRKIALGKLL